MKNKFQVGDRVAGDWFDATSGRYKRKFGEITRLDPDQNRATVGIYHCSFKSLRRLKKKEKRVPREIWMHEYLNGSLGNGYQTKELADKNSPIACIRCVRFREVLDE